MYFHVLILLYVSILHGMSTLRLGSTECRRFYSKNDFGIASREFHHPDYASATISENIPYIFEDGARHSRFNSLYPYLFWGAQITVVPEYKFVYIAIKKAANSEVGELIKKFFGISPFNGCRYIEDCLYVKTQCTSRCLTDEELHGYYFFTFVRDPWTRFVSACSQAKVFPSDSRAIALLQRGLKYHEWSNEHFATQSMSLFAPIRNFSASPPIHYVGTIENFAVDLQEIFIRIEKHANRKLPVSMKEFMMDPSRDFKWKNRSVGRKTLFYQHFLHSASVSVRSLITSVYGQDYACLDYPLPTLTAPMCSVDGLEEWCLMLGRKVVYFDFARYYPVTYQAVEAIVVSYRNYEISCAVLDSFELILFSIMIMKE